MAFASLSDFKKINQRKSVAVILFLSVLSVPVFAKKQEPLSSWLYREKNIAESQLFANISPKGGALGAVAASPSKKNPDYWYHWIRDAAITMNEIVDRQSQMETPEERQKENKMLEDYTAFSRSNQLAKSKTGLGEPKFNMDGSPFNGSWARPQNDGSALRAITLIHWANLLIASGRKQEALKLYNPKRVQDSVIGADLNYVASLWKEPCYDLWEETFGDHFFSRMVQRKALLDGAHLAQRMGDVSMARLYLTQARGLKTELVKHWDPRKKLILPTLHQTNMEYKKSGLDSSVIFGVLMGNAKDGFFSPEDDRVLATLKALENAFEKLYPINRSAHSPGIAIGRYPEDRYNGTDIFKPDNGNPWVLNTEAFSQFYSVLIGDYRKQGEIAVTRGSLPFFQGLPLGKRIRFKAGERISSKNPRFEKIIDALAAMRDRYMKVVRFYANKDGSLSEQIDRKTGRMVSAPNLTWNYAGFLSQDMERQNSR